MKKVLVTSALPYANGPIHLGHLVEYIQTDVYVRFLRLLGKDVIYVCADDAHGTAIEIGARKKNLSPEQFIEEIQKEHVQDFANFSISFDCYHSTHSRENENLSKHIYFKLKEKGDIQKKTVQHFYCEKCSTFLPDRYLLGLCPFCNAPNQYGDICEQCSRVYEPIELVDARCANCNGKPELRQSENIFFCVDEYATFLDSWLDGMRTIQPSIRNSLQSFLDEGLKSWDISRDGPYFGFPIPGTENKYFYVWFDAPIGYIAATEKWCQQSREALDIYWQNNDTEIIHFIGKDIIYFHFLFWPALLRSAQLNLPKHIQVHGHLTVNGQKMSKSRKTYITAKEYLEKHEAEHLRFYFAKLLSNNIVDLDYDETELQRVINNELAAKIGNFANRIIQFAYKNFGPSFEAVQMEHAQIVEDVLDEVSKIRTAYENIDLSQALRHIIALAAIGNRFVQSEQPWSIVLEDMERAKSITAVALNIVHNLAVVLFPIIPEGASKLASQLNTTIDSWEQTGFCHSSFNITPGDLLVERINDKAQDVTEQTCEAEPVFSLELRAGKVSEVTNHPDGDRLFVLQVDFGESQRQVVAGLRGRVEEADLLNHSLLFLTNLESATIRGIKSDGMILAATAGTDVAPLQVNAPPGAIISPGNSKSFRQITLEEFGKYDFFVHNKVVFCQGKPLTYISLPVTAEIADGATIR